jgi:transposase InsO family protein
MSERLAFVQACLDRRKRIVEVCWEFGISEKTGHKLLGRFRRYGVKGLEDRSHAVLAHPFRITPEIEERIVALRIKYPLYGAQMIRDWLQQREPEVRWPAASSIGELLKRRGLIKKRRKHDRDKERAALNSRLTRALEPNLVWTADFKGHFRLRSALRAYCYPLTVMDLYSRFALGITALGDTSVRLTKSSFVSLFREYGLPRVIRTDNGVPFAHPNGVGRLGELAFWWVRLGIKPEHIRPATPSENGAHERFHRTLKAAATKPSSKSFAAQQRRFNEFRAEYNIERPHSSLPGRQPPGQVYSPSPRPYPSKLPRLSYPESDEVRMVCGNGAIKWRSKFIFISSTIIGEYVGIREEDGDRFAVSYGKLQLGHIEAESGEYKARVSWNDSD